MNENFENYNGEQQGVNQVRENYNPIGSRVNGDVPQTQSSLNVVSLVLGIIALLGSFCLSFITLPFSIAGLVCGIKYRKRTQKGCPGIVVNIIAIVLALLMTLISFLITLVMLPLVNTTNDISQQAVSGIEDLQSFLSEMEMPENIDNKTNNNQGTLQDYINTLGNLENEIDNISGVEGKEDNSSSLQNYMSALENFNEEDKKELKSALDSLNEEDKKELKNALNNLSQEDKENLKNMLNNLDEDDKAELKKLAEALKNGKSDISIDDLESYMTLLKGLKAAN